MKRAILTITVLLLFLPFVGQASAYWMDIKGSGKLNEPAQIQICYGHIDEYGVRHRDVGKELELTGDFKLNILDESGQLINIPIQQKADCWEGVFTPKKKGVYRILGINDSHPVVDRSKTGGKNVRPVDYLCAAYLVETTMAGLTGKSAQFLDIIAGNKDDLVALKVFNNNRPVGDKTKLRVFNPENWEKELETNAHGEAFFKPTMKGLYIIRQDWDEPTAGNYKGVSYTNTRYRCNYCLQVL
jgi:hypothetical protein